MKHCSIVMAIVFFIGLGPKARAQWVPTGGPEGRSVYSLAFRGNTLFAGTDSGAFRSTNGGSSWTPVDFGRAVGWVFAFAGDDSSFYTWTTPSFLYYSADDGEHWRLVDTALQTNWYPKRPLFLSHGTTLLSNRSVGGSVGGPPSNAAVCRSTDHGATWVSVLPDILASAFAVQDSVLLVMGEGPAAHPTHAYLYQSSDNGLHWTTVGGLFQYGGLEFAVHDGWLFSGGFGISRSSDHGASWMSAQEGYGTREVSCFAEAPGRLFVGSWTNWVHVSTDDGVHWIQVNEGLTDIGVTSLAIQDNTLYAGGSGVWRRPLSEMTTDVQSSELLLTSFVLDQNYPNPFNPSTTIRYGLPRQSHVLLTVYSTLGQKVAEIVNSEMEAGNHEVTFDASHLASGAYLYRLTAGAFVETKTLLLVR